MRLIPRLHSSSTVRHSGALSRPAARAAASPAGKAASRSASSAPAVGGFLAVLGWLAIFVLLVVVLVVVPIAVWIKTGEPIAVIAPWAAAAFCWWSERREQRQWLRRHGKPRVVNYPVSEAYRAEWGTAERCAEAEKSAPETTWRGFRWWGARWGARKIEAAQAAAVESVPAFVVNELPGADGVYNARVYTVVDALADTMAKADRLGLTGEDRIEALAGVLRGAKPASRSKPPAGSGGAGGGPQGGQGRVRDGAAGPRVEGGGPKGYLKG